MFLIYRTICQWLSNDGEDTIDNTIALCPNCHRKMLKFGKG